MNQILQQFVLLLTILAPSSLAQYCSKRPTGCCPGRDDACHVRYRDTLCYCDLFCERTQSDCCPDFFNYCLGQELKKPTISPKGICIFNGQELIEGQQTKVNCQTCTCLPDFFGGHEIICNNKACLIREDLNQRINQGDYGWTAGNYSFLWGLTLEEGITYRLGTLEPAEMVSRMTEVKLEYETPLPDSFDARDKWPGFIEKVMDQGHCGSSWAFSTTAVASDRHAIQSEGKMDMLLSPQNLLSCNTRGQRGCDGGHLDRAWWYMRKRGVVTDNCYPYMSGQSKDAEMKKYSCMLPGEVTEPCPNVKETSGKYKTSPPYRISTKEDDIRAEIMSNGPVQASFEVKEDFYAYAGGVYKYSDAAANDSPDQKETGWHSIRIIGWGTDYSDPRDPKDYWLCANSWGTSWGEDGYFRIIRGQNECQIESFVLGVWAHLDEDTMPQ
ncbi:uncharacterized peptidase C1-like protein F26E4.3 [Amphiura filiformis]|uniref:uncharacterized peptidase C1-like protein F26E4.3 n=1 Tax=Amphiura filiformis TaxID=82378 RepID=UPI003B222BA8